MSLDGGIFAKYNHLIQQKNTNLEECLLLLREIFPHKKYTESSLKIEGKSITLFLSSSEKTLFLLKKGRSVFEEKGYKVTLS